MSALPTGTVTFVFTDIEGSTRLIQRLGAGHREVLETHTHLLRKAISEAGGIEVGERGDGFFFVFVSACDAAKAAAQIQRSLAEHSWPPEGTVRVRIGMHTGEGVLGGDNYMGMIDIGGNNSTQLKSAAQSPTHPACLPTCKNERLTSPRFASSSYL